MKKLSKGILVILISTVLIVSLVPAISFAASVTSSEKTDDNNIKIESKAKTVFYKITWNGNGGKIGSKKTVTTTVKKGSKLNKLAATPKRSGYTFKGWETKKSGGIKISKNTKPKKSVTYYAQWKKKSSNTNSNRVLNAEEKKLIGTWKWSWNGNMAYTFYENGSYVMVSKSDPYYFTGFIGTYSVKNGVLTTRFQTYKDYDKGKGWELWYGQATSTEKIVFGTENGKQYIVVGTASNSKYIKV